MSSIRHPFAHQSPRISVLHLMHAAEHLYFYFSIYPNGMGWIEPERRPYAPEFFAS